MITYRQVAAEIMIDTADYTRDLYIDDALAIELSMHTAPAPTSNTWRQQADMGMEMAIDSPTDSLTVENIKWDAIDDIPDASAAIYNDSPAAADDDTVVPFNTLYYSAHWSRSSKQIVEITIDATQVVDIARKIAVMLQQPFRIRDSLKSLYHLMMYETNPRDKSRIDYFKHLGHLIRNNLIDDLAETIILLEDFEPDDKISVVYTSGNSSHHLICDLDEGTIPQDTLFFSIIDLISLLSNFCDRHGKTYSGLSDIWAKYFL